jgi:restriction system protein
MTRSEEHENPESAQYAQKLFANFSSPDLVRGWKTAFDCASRRPENLATETQAWAKEHLLVLGLRPITDELRANAAEVEAALRVAWIGQVERMPEGKDPSIDFRVGELNVEVFCPQKQTDERRVVEVDLEQQLKAVLEQVLQLDDKEFEILVGHLLTALGFDGSEVVGKSGDGGVDATGELNVSNLAKVKVFVQAKRYALNQKISSGVVRQLRQAIPFGGQGAFITTAEFQTKAQDIALEAGFPRIGLVNGRQLVDLLVEHWDDIPAEFQELLGLKPGLVRA